jgi:hypothetical protein
MLKRVGRPCRPTTAHWDFSEVPLKTQGEIQAAICEGIASFEQEYMGRGPKIDDEERKFLHELRGEARHVSPEFDLLFTESMKQPPEQHTSG